MPIKKFRKKIIRRSAANNGRGLAALDAASKADGLVLRQRGAAGSSENEVSSDMPVRRARIRLWDSFP
jgi:hypothetical protein